MKAFSPILALVPLALGASIASAQNTAPIGFHLEPGSSFFTGCLPPCHCPVIFWEAQGTLEMTKVDPSPLFADVYTISNVQFLIGNDLGGQVSVTGSGIYWNSTQLGPQHRMELDLSIGGAAPAHFETDWTSDGATDFPRFEISIAENGFFCNDRWWTLKLRPDLFTSFCTSLPNSTGSPALISASGSNSVSANDLVLQASSVPAGKPSLFFFGSHTTQVPLGDGFRCVDGPDLTRFPVILSSPTGNMTFAVDNTDLPGGLTWFPGATWYFQGWFRDTGAGLTGFNLTDGAGILFEL